VRGVRPGEAEGSFRGGECPAGRREGVPPRRCRTGQRQEEYPAMFQSDHSPDLPAGSLLAEVGIDPAAVREAIEDARSR